MGAGCFRTGILEGGTGKKRVSMGDLNIDRAIG
jgi:hypothetical protein